MRTLRERVGVALLLAAGAVAAAVYFGRFPTALQIFWGALRPAAAAGLALLAALAVGSGSVAAARKLLARAGGLDTVSPPDAGDVMLIGVPILGTLLAAIAWIGVALETTVVLATLLLAVVGGLLLWRRPPFSRWRPTAAQVLMLGPPILIGFVGAITPVVSNDELVYKLAVPHLYLLDGRMAELPLNSQSYYPAALSLAALAPLAFSGGIAAKLLHFGVFLLALRTIYRLGRAILPGGETWMTAVIAWAPALMLIAGWSWPDWGLVALLLLSYERWRRFEESQSATDAALETLALAGAAASKYTALLWLLAFAPIAILRMRRRSFRLLPITLAFGVVLFVFGGFFYVRNLLWTGSPVAPFLLADSPPVESFRTGAALEGWRGLLHGDPILDPVIGDDSLGVLLSASVLLSPLALAGPGRRFRDLFAIGLIQSIAFVASAPLWRLAVTGLAPLALLGGAVCVRIFQVCSRPLRAVLALAAVAALVGQLLLVSQILFVTYGFVPYLLGLESSTSYLLRTRDFARAYAWISAKTPEESRFLLIGEIRSYYLDRPFLASGNQDGPRMARYLARFPDAEAFRREIQRRAVTHILLLRPWYRVGPKEAARSALERELVLEIPPSTDRMLSDFLSTRTKRVYSEGGYEIYQIASSRSVLPVE